MIQNKKIILIDWGYFVHAAINSKNSLLKSKQELLEIGQVDKANSMFISPVGYTIWNMLLSNLKKICVTEESIVIIAQDDYGRGNWRTEYDRNYKGNRKQIRQQATFIDWKEEFENANRILDQIIKSTPFYALRIEKLEADDIIAYFTRYYCKDNKIVIISVDADYEQLLCYDNVALFSPHPKRKKNPWKILDVDREKEKQKALKSLMKKIKREAADNLISDINTIEDYEKREKIVKLIELPQEIDKKIEEYIQKVNWNDKLYNNNFLPFKNSKITSRYIDIYSDKNTISYDKQRNKLLKYLDKKI